ncbi:uncharacterized protein LOC141619941 [Silene latifolia]|uniref:uncharacterized protein LOC141619941 n=1 Tax=Silene latifolia TaxID=37657 RepID=UPI003D78534D
MARRCETFNEWIENCEHIELAFTGPPHTWARGNSVDTRQSARLDIALCRPNCGTMFEDAMRELSKQRITYLIKLEARLRRELDEVLDQEEALWHQKSRMEFIKDGDKNTSYFHVSTLVRRWRNRITSLRNGNGDWVDEPADVKKIVVDYYKWLYTEKQPINFEDKLP